MNTKLSTVVFFVLTILLSSCNSYYKKGSKEYSNLQYHKAIGNFNKAIAQSDHHDAKIKLANCYRLTNDYSNAEKMYAEIVKYEDLDAANYFYYSKILMNKGDYVQAKVWLEKYLQEAPNDEVAKMLLASCNSIGEFKKDTTLYSLQNIPFSSFSSMFGQVPYKDGIVFTANKTVSDVKMQEPWTGKSYYDIYFAEKDKDGHWLSPQVLKGEINGFYHEGPATFNKEGDVVYFTRSNYFKSAELIKNAKNENNLKIFSAKLENGSWTHLEELPFNSDDYSMGHPSLSEDQKTLYFISDMPGGFGGTDVYYSKFDGKNWSKPENMGKEVNTSGNEMFPFIAQDSTLYFSSDAHNNLGGLDVFASRYDQKTKQWTQVENLNYPLNSSKDDFAFYIEKDNKKGFVSSNRLEADKIYEFNKNDPKFNLLGTVTVKGKGIPFEGATVVLIHKKDNQKEEKETTLTDKDGHYKFKLKIESDYKVYASKEHYFTQSVELTTKGEKISKDFVVDFELEEIIIEKPIVLENIFYDFDEYYIRPDAAMELDKLVAILNDNPNISIEMGSHADVRGEDEYNMILSNNRAKSAVDYLISKGISADRLTYKGYGESMLVNHCKNDVWCSEENHQKNRRTEFKVTKIKSAS